MSALIKTGVERAATRGHRRGRLWRERKKRGGRMIDVLDSCATSQIDGFRSGLGFACRSASLGRSWDAGHRWAIAWLI